MRAVVETEQGRLAGRAHNGGLAFLGVRYGESTAGRHRFLPPRPVERWAGLRDALSHGASAPQARCPENTDPFHAWYSAVGATSEDCLFLNLYTPGLTAGRPVLVWLHGGGWTQYSGTAPGFDGSALAVAEDVVVVTVNHRLGVFGHLGLDTPDPRFGLSGNAGMLDIVQALEWVRGNIAAFGGNPACVTVFGNSGGGSKVAALMAMPRAQGLFHRAIIQSTGSGQTLATPSEAEAVATALAGALGVPRPDPAALQRLPAGALLRAAASAPPARATIDGRLFDNHPFAGAAPRIAAGIPLMVGCTRTECSYYMRGDAGNFTLPAADALRRMANFFGVAPPQAARIFERYRDLHPGMEPSDLLVLACSDHMFKRPTYGIAEAQARTASAPVFAYHFEWESLVEAGRLRSPHTSEVPFIFGTAPAARACVGPGSDRLTRAMMASWAAFARSGQPGNPHLPDWPPYTADDKAMMCFGLECRVETDPGGPARAGLRGLDPYRYGQPVTPMTCG